MSDLKKELESALMSAPPDEPEPEASIYDEGSVRVIHLEVDNCHACPFQDGEFWMCRKTGSEFYGTPGPGKGILKDCPLPRKKVIGAEHV